MTLPAQTNPTGPPPQGHESARQSPVLLLALGNDLLSDDAIGLHVVREVRRRLAGRAGVDIRETVEMGPALLDFIVGYQTVVIVDAVQTRQAPPGFLHEVEGADLKALPNLAPHFFGIGEILALGRVLKMQMPQRVKIFAVEVQDPFLLGTHLTEPLQQALPGIVNRVIAALQELA